MGSVFALSERDLRKNIQLIGTQNLFVHIVLTKNTFDKVELRLALLASMHDLDTLYLDKLIF